ncbi:MAG: hypothetical protein MI725_06885 [Pirellulales bacterium]|nr:hypothetical protein [Pirellulales bacterium]
MLSQESKLVADKARRLYDERHRKSLEENHQGKFVCIEPESEDFFLGETFDEAVNQAIDAYPNRLTHTLRIGHRVAFHLGEMTQ